VSKVGRNVIPLFVVFHTPPAAAATKNVLDGLGIASMSVTRPSKFAGPTVRQRSALRVSESSVWADAMVAQTIEAPATRDTKRCIRDVEWGEMVAGRDAAAADVELRAKIAMARRLTFG
jgi:hypothetical protein